MILESLKSLGNSADPWEGFLYQPEVDPGNLSGKSIIGDRWASQDPQPNSQQKSAQQKKRNYRFGIQFSWKSFSSVKKASVMCLKI